MRPTAYSLGWQPTESQLDGLDSGHPSVRMKGQVRTDCRHRPVRNARSIPDIDISILTVSNVASISMNAAPAPAAKASSTDPALTDCNVAAKPDFRSATTGSRTQITCDSPSFLLPASTRRFRLHRRAFLIRLIEPQQGIHMRQKAPQVVGWIPAHTQVRLTFPRFLASLHWLQIGKKSIPVRLTSSL